MKYRIILLLICLLSVVKGAEAAEGEEDSLVKSKPIYVSMLPHFLVNLADGRGARYMQMKANTLVANRDTEQALKLHMPAVRHEILMKLSHLKPGDVQTSDQKEALRQDITNTIRLTLRGLSGYDDVKGFYITSVVIQ